MNNSRSLVLFLTVAVAVVVIIVLLGQALSESNESQTEATEPAAASEPTTVASAAQPTGCVYTVEDDRTNVYSIPFSADGYVTQTLEKGASGSIVSQAGVHYYVELPASSGGAPARGWVDAAAGSLSGDGCDSIPVDQTAIEDYDTVCVFAPLTPTSLYAEPELQTASGQLGQEAYIVLQQRGAAIEIMGSDGTTGWVALDEALLSGACTDLSASDATTQEGDTGAGS